MKTAARKESSSFVCSNIPLIVDQIPGRKIITTTISNPRISAFFRKYLGKNATSKELAAAKASQGPRLLLKNRLEPQRKHIVKFRMFGHLPWTRDINQILDRPDGARDPEQYSMQVGGVDIIKCVFRHPRKSLRRALVAAGAGFK